MLRFLQTAGEYDMEVTTYCVMPDHVHILATGLTDAADLIRFVKISKQKAGFDFRATRRQDLWQDGFYDHVLRDDDGMAAVMRYTVNNPVRAGLVRSPLEYDFWGSQSYGREELLDFIVGAEEWIPEWKKKPGRV
jgi:REP-associated tyrosine transposase